MPKHSIRKSANGVDQHMVKMRRGRKPLDDSEKTPKARFKRIAGRRCWLALKAMKGLIACTNPNMYEGTAEQWDDILNRLSKRLATLKTAATSPHKSNGKSGVVRPKVVQNIWA